MRKLFLLPLLLCSAAAAQAAEPSPSPAAAPTLPAQHPLTGNWTWTLPGKACSETWHYSPNGTQKIRSGEELTQSRYEVAAMPSLQGFYQVVETITKANGKPDCAGDLHEASDEPVTRFIQFSPRLDQLIICKEALLKACFGPLQRMPE